MPPSAPLPVRSTGNSAAGLVGGITPIHPHIPGVCHQAVTATAIGYAIDAGSGRANPSLPLPYRRLRGAVHWQSTCSPRRPAATDVFCACLGLLAVPRGHDRQVQTPLDRGYCSSNRSDWSGGISTVSSQEAQSSAGGRPGLPSLVPDPVEDNCEPHSRIAPVNDLAPAPQCPRTAGTAQQPLRFLLQLPAVHLGLPSLSTGTNAFRYHSATSPMMSSQQRRRVPASQPT